MIRPQRLVLYAWNDPQPRAVEPTLPLPVRPYVDELYLPPVIQPGGDGGDARLRVWMMPAKARLHSELANLTDVWVYRESNVVPTHPQVPVGPTIEVRQGQRVQIDWVNALHKPDGGFAEHPVVAVRDLPAYVQFAEGGDVHATENLLGFTLGRRDHSVAQVPPWTVVHLHADEPRRITTAGRRRVTTPDRCKRPPTTIGSRARCSGITTMVWLSHV